MDKIVSQKIVECLRANDFFNDAARAHRIWLQHVEKTLPKGPRGGLPPRVRDARQLNQRIDILGPEAAFDELISNLLYYAERWLHMTDPDVVAERPYLRYVCACLPDSRLSHGEKHGLIFPASHSFWTLWYPPNGLGCMCTVMSVSESLLQRRRWNVSRTAAFKFPLPDEGFRFNVGLLSS